VTAGAQARPGAEPPWQWLSPRSLIVRPVTDLLRLLPVLIGIFFFGSGHGSYWGLAFAGTAIATSFVRYCTTRYAITGERIYLRHGLLSQKVLSVRRDRIRSVDLSAHVVYRLLGLRKVAVGTGRNDHRDGGSLHLDALTLADAEALRAVLLAGARRAGLGDARDDERADAGPAERELARLAPGWIRYAPLTLTGLVIVGVVVGSAFQVVDATHIDITAIGPVHRLTVSLSHLSVIQRALEVALAILVLLVLLSVAGYVGCCPPGPPPSTPGGCAASSSASRSCSGWPGAPAAWPSPPACGSATAPSAAGRCSCRPPRAPWPAPSPPRCWRPRSRTRRRRGQPRCW